MYGGAALFNLRLLQFAAFRPEPAFTRNDHGRESGPDSKCLGATDAAAGKGPVSCRKPQEIVRWSPLFA